MKGKLLIANHILLFLCASMYLGTGGSLVLFSFPIVPQLTPANYYLQFVPQIQAATEFFTIMTKVMLACCTLMLITEWRQRTRWVPIVALAAIIASTTMEVYWVFPLNKEMASHISDPERLRLVLDEWTQLVSVRVALWCLQWAALAWYFARWTWRSRYPTGGI